MGWKCLEWPGPKENNVQCWTGSGNSIPQQASGPQSYMGTEALALSAWYYVYSGSTVQRRRNRWEKKGWAEQTQHCVVTKMSREGLQSIKPQLCAIEAIVLRLIEPDQLAYFRTQCGDRSAFATFFGNFDSDYHRMRHFNNGTSVARHMWKQEFDRIP